MHPPGGGAPNTAVTACAKGALHMSGETGNYEGCGCLGCGCLGLLVIALLLLMFLALLA
jgi:hypothetical protein